MFAPEVLDTTIDRLARLAGNGRAREFALGTGRVAVPLLRRGVPVTGIELSQPMIDQLRTMVDEATIPVIVGDMATERAPGQYALGRPRDGEPAGVEIEVGPKQTGCFTGADADDHHGGEHGSEPVGLGCGDKRFRLSLGERPWLGGRGTSGHCANTTTLQQEYFLDAQTRIVDHHLGNVETNSFSTAESAWNPAMTTAWTQIFQEGAVEGIGFNFDSGDGGDDRGAGIGGGTAVQFPATDLWATAVGGTTLKIGRKGGIIGDLGWGDTGATLNAGATGYLQRPPGDFYQGSNGGRSLFSVNPPTRRAWYPASWRPTTDTSVLSASSPTSPPTPAR